MSKIQSDHDLLLTIKTHVEYIRNDLKLAKKERVFLTQENQARKDWQETMDTKLKAFIGVSTFIGGIVVFIGEKVYDLFTRK